MERFVCIHGHFYQPPRENPWLEEVELQDSAYPFHDWNQRVTEECYWPNAASRILGPDKRIIDIINNYAHISFDFGPTLLRWLQRHAGDLYDLILEADKEGQRRFGGHGPAIAQVYNHQIMPLANQLDKRTAVIWGINDFETRFGRSPEGMWLPETAVDTATLEVLAEYGIKFTILSPMQALEVRPLKGGQWTNVEGERIDTTMPYLCRLPSGRSIAIFLYHGPTAQAVASGYMLQNGEMLTNALLAIVDKSGGLAHLATDGETFGHHHRHTDMALAYCLHLIQSRGLARLTVYGQYLEMFPPTWEVRIKENSSWSCAHGIERWRDNCGCAFGKGMAGKQQWRRPLRQAMDGLRDTLAHIFQSDMAQFCPDPWAARDAYIQVVNDRDPKTIQRFLEQQTGRQLDHGQKVQMMKLLDMQRNALLMYASCGWYFDDIGGIEPIQAMHYACRAIQLAAELGHDDLEPGFELVLEQAQSNDPKLGNGRLIYQTLVKPNAADLHRVGAHLAVSSMFDSCPGQLEVYCYNANITNCQRYEAGLQALVTGRATISSQIVLEEQTMDFAVVRFSEHDVIAAVTDPLPDHQFKAMQDGLRAAFQVGNTTEIVRLMNLIFSGGHYSLHHLFKDQQRQILYRMLENTWDEVHTAFSQIYHRNIRIMHMMRGMGIPLSGALAAVAGYVISEELLATILNEPIDLQKLQDLVEEAARLAIQLDQSTLQFEASRRINGLMEQLRSNPDDLDLLARIEVLLKIISRVVTGLNLQTAQNILFELSKGIYQERRQQAASGDTRARQWCQRLARIGQELGVVV
ncbi:MAG: DUF3536 domain-containing protein [Sedimentisphaerales bacterium]|nr:DUF3536 domain-containing protein [Sedimentisphaerales bacterium]